MKKIIFIIKFCLVLTVVLAANGFAQITLERKELDMSIGNKNLTVTHLFSTEADEYKNSTIEFKFMFGDITSEAKESSCKLSQNNRALVCKLELPFISQPTLSKIGYRLKLKDPSNTVTFPYSWEFTSLKLSKDFIKLSEDLEKLKEDGDMGASNLERINKIKAEYQASQFNKALVSHRTNNRIIVYIELDKAGYVEGEIKCLDNAQPCQNLSPFKRKTKFEQKSELSFENLPENSKYLITLRIQEIGTSEFLDTSFIISDNKGAKTLGSLDSPNISQASLSSENGRFKLSFVSQSEGFYKTILYPLKSGVVDIDNPVEEKGRIANINGKPIGEKLENGENIVYFDKVKSGGLYQARIFAVNEYGIGSTTGIPTATVEFDGTKFGFEKPMALLLSPLSLDVKWKASQKPDSASVTISYPKDDPQATPGLAIEAAQTANISSDGKVVISMGADKMLKVIKGTSLSNESLPTITITMKKDKQTISQSFQFAFRLPNQSAINSISENVTGNKDIKEGLSKLLKSKSNNGIKLNWKTMLKAGLKFVLF